MRSVLPFDLVALAVHLLAIPQASRRNCARRLIGRAQAADRYRKRFGRGHPHWGDGRLASAVPGRAVVREPFISDPEYCRCLIVALSALLEYRGDPGRLSRRRRRP